MGVENINLFQATSISFDVSFYDRLRNTLQDDYATCFIKFKFNIFTHYHELMKVKDFCQTRFDGRWTCFNASEG